jgi:multisubunit Na+/H+ antiporter MnhB subunit
MLVLAMVVALLVLLMGYLPVPAHSDFWRYYPSGGAGASAVLLILLILLVLGRP